MSKYFFDTEFVEYEQKKLFSKSKIILDVISIGIVSDDNRELYLISKDFNLKKAWNKYQLREVYGDMRNIYPSGIKEYWIRQNVLYPIFVYLLERHTDMVNHGLSLGIGFKKENVDFTYKNLKKLINKYGYSNTEIANKICSFTLNLEDFDLSGKSALEYARGNYKLECEKPVFYAYYAAHDWVCMCNIFDGMLSLPKLFPWYVNDLKFILDNEIEKNYIKYHESIKTFDDKLEYLKASTKYPRIQNEHDALHDARFNRDLYEFINYLKQKEHE